jgi:hypothetical protein
MRFEVFAKYGNRWSYKGVFTAPGSLQAAQKAKQSTGRNVFKVRPEGANHPGYNYRLTSPLRKPTA